MNESIALTDNFVGLKLKNGVLKLNTFSSDGKGIESKLNLRDIEVLIDNLHTAERIIRRDS